MKTTRIAALALIATAAIGFNAHAETSDNYQPEAAQKFTSTLSRAQVQADAVKAVRENIQRGYNSESGNFLVGTTTTSSEVGLTREAVRAEAIKARSKQLLVDNAG